MRYHHNAERWAEARDDPSTWACIEYLGNRMAVEEPFPVADERFRHPGIEAIEEALEIHPGADRALVRDFFTYRPGVA